MKPPTTSQENLFANEMSSITTSQKYFFRTISEQGNKVLTQQGGQKNQRDEKKKSLHKGDAMAGHHLIVRNKYRPDNLEGNNNKVIFLNCLV